MKLPARIKMKNQSIKKNMGEEELSNGTAAANQANLGANMSEEELNKEAWRVYKGALEFVKFPANVSVKEQTNGSLVFGMQLSTPNSGKGVFVFEPDISLIKEIVSLRNEKSNKPFQLALAKAEFRFAVTMLKNFQIEIGETFDNLWRIPKLVTFAETADPTKPNRSKIKAGSQQIFESRIKEFEKELNKKKESTKTRVENELKAALGIPDTNLIIFAIFYEMLHKVWTEAKTRYNRNKSDPQCREMIIAACGNLPPDLLEKIENEAQGNDESQPATIALTHAARICGMWQSLGLWTLLRRKKKGEDLRKKAGKRETRKRFVEFIINNFAEIEFKKILARFLGEELAVEDLTFFQEYLEDLPIKTLQNEITNEEYTSVFKQFLDSLPKEIIKELAKIQSS